MTSINQRNVMRHRIKGKKLGRAKGARRALLRNLATSIVLYERVLTTLAKARAVRPFLERAISIARNDGEGARRALNAIFFDRNATKKALEVLGPKYKERHGGYTRIIKVHRRHGDAAERAAIELV